MGSRLGSFEVWGLGVRVYRGLGSGDQRVQGFGSFGDLACSVGVWGSWPFRFEGLGCRILRSRRLGFEGHQVFDSWGLDVLTLSGLIMVLGK